MLKPLLKHEFKATHRFFLPAYGIFAALLLLERLTVFLGIGMNPDTGTFWGQLTQLLFGICTFVTAIGVFAMLYSPFVLSTIRFYRNMMTDQGYLTHTLPVSVSHQIWAKLLIVAVLSCSACGYLAVYGALSIGQTANKHKLLTAFGVYLGMKLAVSFVGQGMTLLVVTLAPDQWANRLEDWLEFSQYAEPYHILCQFLCIVMLIGIALIALLCLGYFLISRYYLSHKLNLS